ncbi:putative f-box domain-containing protein [Botrytis cinerea BcDW1]|nr:putative f-box domain-containing protein [Botrytis cinerea BcDW1]
MIPVFYHRGLSQLQILFDETHATTVDLERQVTLKQINGNARQVDRSRPSLKQLRTKLDRSRKDELTIFRVLSRAREQSTIINNRIDVQSLLRAFRLFKHLQQIRLMRVQDRVDMDWSSFLRERRWIAFSQNNNNNNNTTDPILSLDLDPLEWTAACEHSARALGYAFLESGSPATRFSSRFVNPRIPFLLNSHSHNTISTLANRLTCLEIQIQEPSDDKMYQLSSLFNTFFTSAHQIQGLHVGFPSNRPLAHVPLEAVFHNVTWENLRYLGFGAWHLDSEEIIGLLRRHKYTLRSVRLRSVKLKEGSSWIEVVRMLRRELRELKWVSLRGIGYVGGGTNGNTNGIAGVGGIGIGMGPGNQGNNPIINNPIDADMDLDDSSDESDEEVDFEDTAIGDRTLSHHSSSVHLPSSSSASSLNKEKGLELGEQNRRGGGEGRVCHEEINCECANGYAMADLGEQGSEVVLKQHWKFWELWAVKRCAVHDGMC